MSLVEWLQSLHSAAVKANEEPLATMAEELLAKYGNHESGKRPRSTDALQDVIDRFASDFNQLLTEAYLEDWSVILTAVPLQGIPRTRSQLAELGNLSSKWGKLCASVRFTRNETCEEFIECLAQMLNWKIVSRQTLNGLLVLSVTISRPQLNLAPQAPVVLTVLGEVDPGRSAEETLTARDAIQGMRGGLVTTVMNLIANPGEDVSLMRRYKEKLQGESVFLFLGPSELKGLALSENRNQRMSIIVRKSLGVSRINPYKYLEAVERPDMFFGRSQEILRILGTSDSDFAIVGSRRIGKTSLVKQLARTYESQDRGRAIYINCGAIPDANELINRIAIHLNPRLANMITMSTLPRLFRAFRTTKRESFLMILDEVDWLVEQAADTSKWSLFELLRDLSQQELIQAVFVGYRVLHEAYLNMKSPLYNFAFPIYLSTLDRRSAKQLAERPMHGIGFTYESDEIVRNIISETGCHPCFVQFLCRQLLESISREDTAIRWSHFKAVHDAKGFHDILLQPYTTEANLTPLEKLILAEAADGGVDVFDASTVMLVLDEHKLNCNTGMVMRALGNLEIAGLLTSISRKSDKDKEKAGKMKYRFTIPAFPNTLKHAYPMEREKKDLAERIRASLRGRRE